MKVKIPYRVFFILSAYSENMWKVFKRIWRMRRIYFNLGLFAGHKAVSEYAERICAHMERTPRDTKLEIS